MNKNKPEFITFTGIDDRTDLTRADELARQYPIEWGILRCNRSGEARFPSHQAINEILDISGRKSCHLCAKFSKAFQKMEEAEILNLSAYDRIQVNGFKIKTENFSEQADKYDVDIIVQWREETFDNNDFSIHQPLYDLSGGQGIFPDKFPEIPDSLGGLVGLAGGLSPETIEQFLSMIESNGKYWIDMESRVRTNGWMDLNKVEYICEKVYG